jgi:SAM-dependent methyltransferase
VHHRDLVGLGEAIDVFDVAVTDLAERRRRRDREPPLPAQKPAHLTDRLQFGDIALQEEPVHRPARQRGVIPQSGRIVAHRSLPGLEQPGSYDRCNGGALRAPPAQSAEKGLVLLGSMRLLATASSAQRACVTVLVMDASKAAVRDFWDETSCGEVYAGGETPRARFAAHAETRFRLEPYIEPFARFDGTRRQVLEVGVGMGADHVRWASSGPQRLVGVDLTARAVDWTAKRLELLGLSSELSVADAETLPFPDNIFDIVYSWGALQHTPDTSRAFREVHRVLKPGGTARIMVYHRPSVVGYMLWAKYGLLAGRPWRSLIDLYAEHLESPGTKGYTMDEGRSLVSMFGTSRVESRLGVGDLLEGQVGQRHQSTALRFAKRVWPRRAIKRWLPRHGLILLIEATK